MRIRYHSPNVVAIVRRIIANTIERKLEPLIIPGSVEVEYVPRLQLEATARNIFGKRVRVDVDAIFTLR